MSEIPKNQNPEEELPILENNEPQIEQEMPEDFEDPEGKSGKWKTVKGEVEVNGEKFEVSYREKVIQLSEDRQEKYGIQRIRRRELLPPLPEGFLIKRETKTDDNNVGNLSTYSSDKKFDEMYRFLTDDKYPSDHTITHKFHWFEKPKGAYGYEKQTNDLQMFKEQGLYFQEIFQGKSEKKTLYCSPKWIFDLPNYSRPVFIFGNKNKAFNNYLDSIFNKDELKKQIDYKRLKVLRDGGQIEGGTSASYEWFLPVIHQPGIKPLRWCHAESALIPTKRSLNVLFFETGDENKSEE